MQISRVASLFALALASCLLLMRASRSSPLYRASDLAWLAVPWLTTALLVLWLTMGGPHAP
jgi:hypothetical protein